MRQWRSLTAPCTLFFFFQAEDGIRDYKVTGVQTCALPICVAPRAGPPRPRAPRAPRRGRGARRATACARTRPSSGPRSEEHTSELQSPCNLVCRLLLEKKKTDTKTHHYVTTRKIACRLRGER